MRHRIRNRQTACLTCPSLVHETKFDQVKVLSNLAKHVVYGSIFRISYSLLAGYFVMMHADPSGAHHTSCTSRWRDTRGEIEKTLDDATSVKHDLLPRVLRRNHGPHLPKILTSFGRFKFIRNNTAALSFDTHNLDSGVRAPYKGKTRTYR